MKELEKITYFFTLLVIAFTPLDAIQVDDGEGVTYGRYFFIAMAVSAIFSGRLSLAKMPKFVHPLGVFIVWAFFTCIWSVDTDVSLYRVLYLLQYLIIVVVMLNTLNTPKRLKLAMLAWGIGSVYIAYKTALDFSGNAYASDTLYRVASFGNPNENSFMLCYALIFCYIIDSTKLKIPSIALTLLSSYAISANGSRMGFILFLVSITSFVIYLAYNGQKKIILILVPCVFIFIGYVIANLPELTLQRLLGISSDIENRSLAHRDEIWKAAFAALSANDLWLIFGCGWGSFSYAIVPYVGRFIGCHNFYINLLMTTGIVGLSIVLYYFTILFSYIRRTYKRNILNYMLIVVPLISMASTNWESRRWWFLMGAFIYLLFKNNNCYSKN